MEMVIIFCMPESLDVNAAIDNYLIKISRNRLKEIDKTNEVSGLTSGEEPLATQFHQIGFPCEITGGWAFVRCANITLCSSRR